MWRPEWQIRMATFQRQHIPLVEEVQRILEEGEQRTLEGELHLRILHRMVPVGEHILLRTAGEVRSVATGFVGAGGHIRTVVVGEV